MNKIVDRFNIIQSNIKKDKNFNKIKIVAVSKTFELSHIKPLIS